MSKKELADAQICAFRNDLAQALPETTVYYTICQDSSAAEPTIINDSFDAKCDHHGNVTMIKTAWLQDLETEYDDSTGRLKTSVTALSILTKHGYRINHE